MEYLAQRQKKTNSHFHMAEGGMISMASGITYAQATIEFCPFFKRIIKARPHTELDKVGCLPESIFLEEVAHFTKATTKYIKLEDLQGSEGLQRRLAQKSLIFGNYLMRIGKDLHQYNIKTRRPDSRIGRIHHPILESGRLVLRARFARSHRRSPYLIWRIGCVVSSCRVKEKKFSSFAVIIWAGSQSWRKENVLVLWSCKPTNQPLGAWEAFN